jgi:basic amino acid/polyamine antiporter, APA family
VNGAYFRLVPPERMAEGFDAGGELARRLLGPSGGRVVSLLLSVVCLGSASSIVIVGPRIHYAMARDRLLPGGLARLGSSSHSPLRALWTQSTWTAILVASGTFERIVSRTIFAILPFAALSAAAVFVFRRRDRRSGLRPPFEIPWYPALPLAFIAVALLLAGVYAIRNPADAVLGALIVLCGAPLYVLGWWLGRGAA